MKKKLPLILGIVAALLIGALVIGYFTLNSIVKKGVETLGPPAVKAPVTLGGVSISPLSGKGTISDLVIGNPTGFKTESAIKVGTASLAVDPSSLLSDKIVVRSVRVEGPELTFEGSLQGSNLSAILANLQAFAATDKATPKEKGKAGKKLQLDEFVMTGGKISLSLTMLGGKSATVPLPEIKLSNLGQGADGITPADAVAQVFKAVFEGTLTAVTGAIADLGKGVGKGVTDGASKAVKGIGDLFKK